MGFVKNLPAVLQGVNLKMVQAKAFADERYADYVWEIFKRILRETPQYTGKAVAHWNLSVGSPNYTTYDDVGDEAGPTGMNFKDGGGQSVASAGRSQPTHQRGDERWMRRARDRARPIKMAIKARDKVFISNGVKGDGDDVGAELYMQALQNPGYWTQKLRQANQPYEIAQESVIVVALQYSKKGFLPPQMSGRSWTKE